MEVKNGDGCELFIPLVLYSVMPEGYEEETMKAMVVIIRTYIIHKMDGNETINAETLGLPYTTYVELEKNGEQNMRKHTIIQ